LHLESGPPTKRPSLEDVRTGILRDFGITMAIGAGATKAVAAVAARLIAPSGLLMVLRGYEARLLAPLDVARMPGLGDDAVARLRGRGVNTLGELAALDEPVLRDLIGPGGSVIARHALGLDDRSVAESGVLKGIVRSAIFGSCGPTQARGAILRLSDQAARALRQSGHAARQIRLRVRDAAGERVRVQIIEPLTSDADLSEQVDRLARRLLHPGRELLEAAVSFTALSPVAPQLELFASVSRSA
jgi:DNA polymerase-4